MSTYEQAVEALRAARACILTDRTCLADASLDLSGRFDLDTATALAEYDAVMQQIDAVLAVPVAAAASPVLVRDVADMLGTTVAAVSAAFVALGYAPRSTNMAVTGEEAVQVAVHLRAAQAAPHGFALVWSPITEAMHAAACKVLAWANGLDGTPQRMLDAMLAAQAEPAPQWQQMGAESPEQWERFKAWQRQEGGQG